MFSRFGSIWPSSEIKTFCMSILAITATFCFKFCHGHGRLIEPPSRASAWRYGFQTTPDYNDHELYCGGFTRQWRTNEGRCGECGDAWDMPEPRPHEYGGLWGSGVIVRRYSPGSEITIRVELTASHMGYFEFRICPEPGAKQECLDKFLLPLLGGTPSVPSAEDLETRFYPRNGSRIYEIRGQLPDIECEHCMLQWRYIAGNNWGMCPNGNGAVGCGPQEEFRACSDIAISDKVPTRPPLRPTARTTTRPAISSTEKTHSVHDNEDTFEYTSLVLGLLLLLLLISFGFAIYYLTRQSKYKTRVNEWLEILGNRFCKKHVKDIRSSVIVPSNVSSTASGPILHQATVVPSVRTKSVDAETANSNPIPVPPPRGKRAVRT